MEPQREAATEASCLPSSLAAEEEEGAEHQAHTRESHGAPCTLAPWRTRGLCKTKMRQLSKLLQLPVWLPLFSLLMMSSLLLLVLLLPFLLFLHFLLTLLELPLNQWQELQRSLLQRQLHRVDELQKHLWQQMRAGRLGSLLELTGGAMVRHAAVLPLLLTSISWSRKK